jgi:hypothetical protein
MDLTGLIFYAVICGALGVAAPNFPNSVSRLVFGAIVGVLAAFSLPYLKQMI